MDEEGFYLSLNASASYNMYRDNTLATFKNDLHSPIDFDQEQWMVGLAEVQIDSGVINVSHADAKFSVQREMLVENLNNKRARKAIDSYLDIKAVTPKKDMFLTRNYVSIQDLKNVFADAQSSEEDEEELEAVWIKDKFSFEIDSKHYNRAEDVIQAINKALNVKRDELKNLWLISDPVLDDTQTDDSKRKLSISISTEAINEKYVFTFSKQLAFLLGSGTDNVLTLNHFPLVCKSAIRHVVPKFACIYTDLVKPQYFGDSMTRLLRTVPLIPQSSSGEEIHTLTSSLAYDKLHYVRIEHNYISTIAVNITTLYGSPYPFTNGSLTLKLHFKRVV
ncbi:unnamed protein product [Rotaria socialis]|uniref:Uncharacterized protein n=2 Tax=Rotaria TaxID=231623 RepID=A0A821R462_9BILA|nr:unnamed protein product [Rotaria socialis]CAF4837350.1 unnamed protein product [Rotaria socialis]